MPFPFSSFVVCPFASSSTTPTIEISAVVFPIFDDGGSFTSGEYLAWYYKMKREKVGKGRGLTALIPSELINSSNQFPNPYGIVEPKVYGGRREQDGSVLG